MYQGDNSSADNSGFKIELSIPNDMFVNAWGGDVPLSSEHWIDLYGIIYPYKWCDGVRSGHLSLSFLP